MRAAALLLLAVLLSPVVIADAHAYSHRYVFEGRVVGADGYPIVGEEVRFEAVGDTFDEACPDDSSRPVTDEFGDFRLCFAKRELKTSTRITIHAGNASEERAMDTGFRRTIVRLTDETRNGTAPEGWDETFRIDGKVWRRGDTELEGVHVFGLAIAHVPVVVTLRVGEEETRHELRTDAYGDFKAIVRLSPEADPEEARVVIETEGFTQTRRLDHAHHRLIVGAMLPPLETSQPSGVDAGFVQDARASPVPGRSNGPVTWGLVAGLALVGILVGVRIGTQK